MIGAIEGRIIGYIRNHFQEEVEDLIGGRFVSPKDSDKEHELLSKIDSAQ